MTDVRDRLHGYPYEIVIPCMTLEESNEEKADLNVAAEARAFIREVTPETGFTLTSEETAVLRSWLPKRAEGSILQVLAARLGATQ